MLIISQEITDQQTGESVAFCLFLFRAYFSNTGLLEFRIGDLTLDWSGVSAVEGLFARTYFYFPISTSTSEDIIRNESQFFAKKNKCQVKNQNTK
jgi:hypothetical protein